MAHGVDGGDAQAVGHRRVGGAAPALAQDPPLPGEAHRVPHDQEEAGEAQPRDDAQLVLQLRPLPLVHFAPALPRAPERQLPQPRVVAMARRHPEVGHGRPQPAQVEAARRRHLRARRQPLLPAPPQLRHLLRRLQPPLAVGVQHAPRRRRVHVQPRPQRREQVVHQPAGPVQVARLVGRHPRQPLPPRQLDERARQRRLLARHMVQLGLDGQPPRKQLPPARQHVRRLLRPQRTHQARHLARGAAGEGVEAG